MEKTASPENTTADNSVVLETDFVDLGALDSVALSESGVEFEVMHPITGATGLHIRLLGAHSEQVRSELKRINVRRKATNRAVQKDDPAVEDANFLAGITLGWRAEKGGKPVPVKLHGKELVFSRQSAFEMYKSLPLVRDQAFDFALRAENFLPDSGPN